MTPVRLRATVGALAPRFGRGFIVPTTSANPPFDSVESAIQDIAAGRLVIVTDDEDRENEGDLIMAAAMIRSPSFSRSSSSVTMTIRSAAMS